MSTIKTYRGMNYEIFCEEAGIEGMGYDVFGEDGECLYGGSGKHYTLEQCETEAQGCIDHELDFERITDKARVQKTLDVIENWKWQMYVDGDEVSQAIEDLKTYMKFNWKNEK